MMRQPSPSFAGRAQESKTLKYGIQVGALVLTVMACSTGNEVLVGYNRDHPVGGSADTTALAGGAFSVGPPTASGQAGTSPSPTLDACMNGGPAFALPTIGGCTYDLAKRVFLFAICTCSDFLATSGVHTAPLKALTSGFNLGASIGVNGTYQADGADARLGGSLWVLGQAQFGRHDVLGDLRCGSSVTVTSESSVHRNASVRGDLSAPTLTIAGTLNQVQGAASEVKSVTGGTEIVSDLFIPPPCDCSNPVDVASIVGYFKNDNDNARVALAVSSFAARDEDLDRTLPCGRYYFDSFGGVGAITLHLTGKTLIAVGERFSNSNGISFDLAPGAELDLFIAGDLELSGPVVVGNASRPSATRVYVGGQAAFSTNLKLHANWYVPNSLLAMSAPSEFWGAIYARSLRSAAGLTVHYDDSVLDLPGCSPSGQSCESCHDCANPTPACHGGRCEACQVDSDCCPPLYCNQGRCQTAPILI